MAGALVYAPTEKELVLRVKPKPFEMKLALQDFVEAHEYMRAALFGFGEAKTATQTVETPPSVSAPIPNNYTSDPRFPISLDMANGQSHSPEVTFITKGSSFNAGQSESTASPPRFASRDLAAGFVLEQAQEEQLLAQIGPVARDFMVACVGLSFARMDAAAAKRVSRAMQEYLGPLILSTEAAEDLFWQSYTHLPAILNRETSLTAEQKQSILDNYFSNLYGKPDENGRYRQGTKVWGMASNDGEIRQKMLQSNGELAADNAHLASKMVGASYASFVFLDDELFGHAETIAMARDELAWLADQTPKLDGVSAERRSRMEAMAGAAHVDLTASVDAARNEIRSVIEQVDAVIKAMNEGREFDGAATDAALQHYRRLANRYAMAEGSLYKRAGNKKVELPPDEALAAFERKSKDNVAESKAAPLNPADQKSRNELPASFEPDKALAGYMAIQSALNHIGRGCLVVPPTLPEQSCTYGVDASKFRPATGADMDGRETDKDPHKGYVDVAWDVIIDRSKSLNREESKSFAAFLAQKAAEANSDSPPGSFEILSSTQVGDGHYSVVMRRRFEIRSDEDVRNLDLRMFAPASLSSESGRVQIYQLRAAIPGEDMEITLKNPDLHSWNLRVVLSRQNPFVRGADEKSVISQSPNTNELVTGQRQDVTIEQVLPTLRRDYGIGFADPVFGSYYLDSYGPGMFTDPASKKMVKILGITNPNTGDVSVGPITREAVQTAIRTTLDSLVFDSFHKEIIGPDGSRRTVVEGTLDEIGTRGNPTVAQLTRDAAIQAYYSAAMSIAKQQGNSALENEFGAMAQHYTGYSLGDTYSLFAPNARALQNLDNWALSGMHSLHRAAEQNGLKFIFQTSKNFQATLTFFTDPNATLRGTGMGYDIDATIGAGAGVLWDIIRSRNGPIPFDVRMDFWVGYFHPMGQQKTAYNGDILGATDQAFLAADEKNYTLCNYYLNQLKTMYFLQSDDDGQKRAQAAIDAAARVADGTYQPDMLDAALSSLRGHNTIYYKGMDTSSAHLRVGRYAAGPYLYSLDDFMTSDFVVPDLRIRIFNPDPVRLGNRAWVDYELVMGLPPDLTLLKLPISIGRKPKYGVSNSQMMDDITSRATAFNSALASVPNLEGRAAITWALPWIDKTSLSLYGTGVMTGLLVNEVGVRVTNAVNLGPGELRTLLTVAGTTPMNELGLGAGGELHYLIPEVLGHFWTDIYAGGEIKEGVNSVFTNYKVGASVGVTLPFGNTAAPGPMKETPFEPYSWPTGAVNPNPSQMAAPLQEMTITTTRTAPGGAPVTTHEVIERPLPTEPKKEEAARQPAPEREQTQTGEATGARAGRQTQTREPAE